MIQRNQEVFGRTLNDQDNISIQIQDVSYCGGSGRLGEICP